MQRVVYVGGFRFPEGDAAAARVLGIGKALRVCGFEVVFAGGEEAGRTEDVRPDGSYACQGNSEQGWPIRKRGTLEYITWAAERWSRHDGSVLGWLGNVPAVVKPPIRTAKQPRHMRRYDMTRRTRRVE